MAKQLLASIHDVGPKFESEVDRLASLYQGLGVSRFAMLVVPNHWGDAPLASASGFKTKLRGWADSGMEIFVHGWFHRDDAQHTAFARFKAQHMTAGEGEFLGLEYDDARARMTDGKALIEDIIGRTVAGFIAPAWLYGRAAKQALADSDFAIAEDHLRVWHPRDGEVLAKGPVITWASRSTARIASSHAVAAAAPFVLRGQRVVRLAVHPGDVHVPSLVTSIKSTVRRLSRHRQIGRYADLLHGLPGDVPPRITQM